MMLTHSTRSVVYSVRTTLFNTKFIERTQAHVMGLKISSVKNLPESYVIFKTISLEKNIPNENSQISSWRTVSFSWICTWRTEPSADSLPTCRRHVRSGTAVMQHRDCGFNYCCWPYFVYVFRCSLTYAFFNSEKYRLIWQNLGFCEKRAIFSEFILFPTSKKLCFFLYFLYIVPETQKMSPFS